MVVVLGVSLGLSACAGDLQKPDGQIDAVTATARPTESFDPAPRLTLPTGQPSGLPSYDWELRGMSPDQRRLYLRYGSAGGCGYGLAGIYVEERPDYVGIAALVGNLPSAGPCDASLSRMQGYIDLAEPLNGRKLIHLA